jgi:sucrose phosphorylase
MAMDSTLKEQLVHYLSQVYPPELLAKAQLDSTEALADTLIAEFHLTPEQQVEAPPPYQNHWDEQRTVLITYADSITSPGQVPLQTLYDFVVQYCHNSVSDIHILPFYPYSTDDGFAVIDYASVNPSHGTWDDIQALSVQKNLMFDLVINHCSTLSQWFLEFCEGKGKGAEMFFCASPDDDLSQVTRPRTSPLLREVNTPQGVRHVWCTFSHDQVDFDFTHPMVLLEFAKIIRLYLEQGATLFRLDAVAFLWKEIGTNCINHPHTHTIIKIYRLLIEHAKHDAVIITETNIPNIENLQYFGNANEAHAIYNFALPPLLLHTLLSGDSLALTHWQRSMPPAQNGTTYFNFIASHDGIGLRPAEGLLSDAQIQKMVDTCLSYKGKINWRSLPNGEQSPYELNIALISALSGTHAGADDWQVPRFICAHAIMLGLEGIPGIYIHSLLGTPNDLEKLRHTGQNRGINRHRWDYAKLQASLDDASCVHHQVFTQLSQLIRVRALQPAFHPNAIQFTLQLGTQCFGFWRQSLDRRQSIFCISNVTNQAQTLNVSDINLINTQQWQDLISLKVIDPHQPDLHLTPYQTVWITNVTA